MIINLLLNVFILFIGAIFSWLDVVETLPQIGGYDIDTALVNGVGQMNQFFFTFWYLQIMFYGFLFLLGYFAVKNIIKFFLGSHTPGD